MKAVLMASSLALISLHTHIRPLRGDYAENRRQEKPPMTRTIAISVSVKPNCVYLSLVRIVKCPWMWGSSFIFRSKFGIRLIFLGC